MAESQYTLEQHRKRVYDQLDRLEDRATKSETRLAVIESKQSRIDDIAEDVAAIRDAVLGLPDNPNSGLVARVAAQEATEAVEHGAIRVAVVTVPIVVGVAGLALKLMGVL